MNPLRVLAFSAIAALSVATAAQAQTAPNSPSSGLQALHDALMLSPDQTTAWIAFRQAEQPDPDQEARQRSAAGLMPTLRAPQRVDLTIAAMEADLQTLKTRGAALKAFYAQLTPAQQAIFDSKTAPHAPSANDD
jgi:protein CpxP